jgi:hypothetical protein
VQAGDSGAVVADSGGGLPAFDAGGGFGGAADSGGIVPFDAGHTPSDGGALFDAAADSGIVAADSGVPADGGARDATTSVPPGQMLPPVTDYSAPGPFKTTVEANVGPNNNYTIFRPDPLGANGFLHSPIIFGPGIITWADLYSNLLTHLASHGFVTICVNSMGGGPGDPANLSDMTMGLDWLIAQNNQAGTFQGKLAVDRAIAMGYSIGATASVELSSHKAIMTTVVIHGHNTKGDPHGPVLMMTGTSDVIDDMRQTLTTLDEAPAVLVALPIDHLDVPTEIAMLGDISPETRYIAPITGWLRYWVNGDQSAKRFFWGADCEMCKSPWITPEPNAKWKALML